MLQTSGNMQFYPQQHSCPTCGYCPTCGRQTHGLNPMPYYPTPFITSSGTTAGNLAPDYIATVATGLKNGR